MVDAIFAPLPADQEWTPLPGLGELRDLQNLIVEDHEAGDG